MEVDSLWLSHFKFCRIWGSASSEEKRAPCLGKRGCCLRDRGRQEREGSLWDGAEGEKALSRQYWVEIRGQSDSASSRGSLQIDGHLSRIRHSCWGKQDWAFKLRKCCSRRKERPSIPHTWGTVGESSGPTTWGWVHAADWEAENAQ